jgi:hypothetical protein
VSDHDFALLGWWLLAAGLPIFICSLVIFRRSGSNWMTLALLALGWLGGLHSLFAGAWSYYSYWSAAVVLLFMIWAVAAALQHIRTGSWGYPGMQVSIFAGLWFGLAAYFLVMNVAAVKNIRPTAPAVDLAFPFEDGIFAISQGGSGPPLQSTHLGSPAQVFAVDITMLNKAGLGRDSLSSTGPESWVIWGKPVLSPCSGEVVWARDGIVDRIGRDPETPAGNVVAIECNGVIVYLAHFRQGTVQVRQGGMVETGQLLGEMGASGNTGGPHLHIHAEKPPFAGEFSQNDGVPMTFGGRFLWKPLVIPVD